MSELVIWGRTNSINVQKVLWTCAELELAFERIDAGLQFGVNKTPEYMQNNPNGLVPLINDGGFILWESHAIMRYLARKHDHQGAIAPQDPQKDALVDQWLDWYNTVAWPAMKPLFWGWIRTPAEQRNLEELEKARLQMVLILEMLEKQLGKAVYVSGAQFTLADIPLALLAFRWFNLPLERPSFPNLSKWYEEIAKRPGFQKYSSGPLT